jgi:hypothetical protein
MRLSNKAPLSPAERQKRYRASRDLLSIDIRRETVEAISKLRVQTGLATDAVIKAALLALTERLNKRRHRDGERLHPKGAWTWAAYRIPDHRADGSAVGSR